MTNERGHVLVVDDVETNRELLARRLRRQGHTVTIAENGIQALELLRSQPFDLVLLDIMMPQMDGFEVLEQLKADSELRYLPVVMISALDDLDSVVRCIELGAEDYLFKPFNPILLQARIRACLEKKRLRDQEQAYLEKLQAEQEKSEKLLLNILPQAIADRLKQGKSTIADSFADVTVLFADIVGFTKLAAQLDPTELINLLNDVFSVFDNLADLHGLEKIKTIGDAYMVVGGLPTPKANHAEAIAEMALDMQDAVSNVKTKTGEAFSIRIGIHTGPVVAGVIGQKKFTYDLWGDTVNIASRMESHGVAGAIQLTTTTFELLRDRYLFQKRGTIFVKDKGEMTTYLLLGKKAED
ncbi:response regulator [Desertifilum sp. FACHB-1129]|uniref:Adenylate cyclase n=1 Tax=Desertifilum tharense IPPAS B-1220 TaxID=1781255 RepID=A0A1E5QE14_9CYAN|nr:MULTISPECIES: adenylate/guanylate cyclase domain-containing protein [Desertifilum]MCD8489168.1 response regulator [Desertifilum sp.]MDA0213501.1 response regulator [Cyanobacteria bacterium FC1]MBD2311402.1 response regulator [Desertifilum sp. FACHB-1129]MBD2321648.1 response regulator [Desertifilum sp. FACHB-866]MBD2331775.1 response regulator [Desertifilum sp. FACHB-868]